MVDPVGLIHMNGRVYDADIGRFLSADPHVQAADNLQNWNRYSYVLNNPLSYTDPTGYFFKGLFKKLGRAIGKIFKAVGRAIKKVLASPIFRAILNIIACANPAAVATCAAVSSALSFAGTLAAGGSLRDAFKAAAFAAASVAVWVPVGNVVRSLGLSGVGLAAAKGVIHGAVGGALSAAQGGNFLEGFASSAIGAVAGVFSDGLSGGEIGFDTAIVAAAGCAGALVSGGKCANGALTAAFANLYNKYGRHLATKAQEAFSANIAQWAKAQVGQELWNKNVAKGSYAVGSNKCNKSVYDALHANGIDLSRPNGHWLKRLLGAGSPPTASQGANRNYSIPGTKIVAIPIPGDVGAYQIGDGQSANGTGHVAIVTGSELATGTSGTYREIREQSFKHTFSKPPTFRGICGDNC